jgi:hypothetical protein
MGQDSKASKTVLEPAREINVCAEADVVVVGGGPGGIGAAVAAARNGAKTVLVERYGHLGGLATGGLVIAIPGMSDNTGEQLIAGICQEWIDRLEPLGGTLHPRKEDLGSSNPALISKWRHYFSTVVDNKIVLCVNVDPELLKCVLNDMVTEAGIKLYLHSWGTRAIAEDGAVKGVVFESKSGRQAILAKVVVDATGDGDLLSSAGAGFDATWDPKLRSSQLALVFRLGNIDFNKFCDFHFNEAEKYEAVMEGLRQIGGFRMLALGSSREDIVWINNWLSGVSAIDVDDLTKTELLVRKTMPKAKDYLAKNMPGFENCFIVDTASQIGTRGSRRLDGEYTLTGQDLHSGAVHRDAIAVFPRMRGAASGERARVDIPYRVLVPRNVEGLLVAGRSFSSDGVANNTYNLIPHCVALGEAAGTAAALALKAGVSVRNVNVTDVQRRLVDQGVPLPGVLEAAAKQ